MFASNTSQVSSDAVFIEDVMSTYLYTGNDSAQTITNGIDLAGKGGLIWTKGRSDAGNNWFVDTVRGINFGLYSNSTNAQFNDLGTFSGVSSTGYSMNNMYGDLNASGRTYASWTFRKQPKFFDVVTYTGTGVARTIAHSLGSVPACIIVKCTNAAGKDWHVYHTSLGNTKYINLNLTSASTSSSTIWNSTTPTSTVFSLGADGLVNDIGDQYVAYLFAHNAGGFGLTGTDNVISCGSYTGNGSTSGPSITLGYEPQWILTKNATSSGWNWNMFDNMRGLPVGSGDLALQANLSNAESGALNWIDPTATGFNITSSNAQINESGSTIIYIAIRRGPMKVPTSGTSVFSPEIGLNAASNGLAFDSGFVSDFLIRKYRPGTSNIPAVSRLTGDKGLYTTTTGAEYTETYASKWDSMLGVLTGTSGDFSEQIGWVMRRAPSFFDVVCYTGTGSAMTIPHNLGVAPEFIIAKDRSVGGQNWVVYHSALGPTKGIFLNLTNAVGTSAAYWNNTAPTATNVYNYGWDWNGGSGYTYVMYLFASCPGVSKVTSFTGNGSSQTINCGFTGGARFVLIKRTDSTGDWYIWDSARGIVSGNDPHLSLNSTAAEVTTDDTIDTDSTGFIVNQVSATNCNVNGASYIVLAVA